jgi:hypothetical protein
VDQYLIALMVGFRESYILAGCDGHFEDPDEQATYNEVVPLTSLVVAAGLF